jgi:hypothetical protein
MIATTFKANIPRTHSYPVGAESLTESLSSVPQLDQLTLKFHGLWSRQEGNLQPVLTVNHFNFRESQFSSKDSVARGVYQDTWEIEVYPVLREQKAEIKHFFITEGLSQVRSWLSAPRSPTWLEGRRTLSIMFDEVSRSLHYREDGKG